MTSPGIPWRERLHNYIDQSAGECWLWTGATCHNGYGMFNGPVGHPIRPMTVAHRWVYYALRGPIPDGLELDHLCNVRACVNPNHLEPVTQQENMRRRSERQTHCKNGHEFTEANTYVRSDGGRKCRRCAADRQLAYMARRAVTA